jgi:hypothetical protein
MIIYSRIHDKDKKLLNNMFEKNEPFYKKSEKLNQKKISKEEVTKWKE